MRADAATELADLDSLLRLSNDQVTTRCLLVSPAGGGKSLTCLKVLSDWASGAALREYTFAAFIRVRDLHQAEADSWSGLFGIQDFFSTSPAGQDWIIDHLHRNSRELLVVLDGADEAGPLSLCKQYPLVGKLLRGESFPKASLLVTSRPGHAAEELVALCRQHLTIVGFSQARLREFLRRRVGSESSESLLRAFSTPTGRHLLDMVQTSPLLAAIVAELYEEEESLPTSIAQLYNVMLKNQLVRCVRKDAGQSEEEALQELLAIEVLNPCTGHRESTEFEEYDLECKPSFAAERTGCDGKQLGEVFMSMCELAVLNLRLGRYAFPLPACLKSPKALRLINCLGILPVSTSHRLVSTAGEVFVSFSHVTWQEFLSALHLAKSGDIEHAMLQSVEITRLACDDAMTTSLRSFLAAFLGEHQMQLLLAAAKEY